jgi:hypothetical protein
MPYYSFTVIFEKSMIHFMIELNLSSLSSVTETGKPKESGSSDPFSGVNHLA